MSKDKRRFGRRAVAVIALAFALVPATSIAHRKHYPTAVTVSMVKGANVEGNVVSIPRCLSQRSVGVYSPTGVVLAETKTDVTGHWQVKLKLTVPGTYYAVVKRRVIRRTRHHRHICRASTASFPVT